VRPRRDFDDIKNRQSREIPKGLLTALISVGALLIVGIVVVGVLLLTQPTNPVSAELSPSASQTAEPEATATPEPTQAATPVPTTEPEESDDISAIFEAPDNPILEESQNQ
jgi:amino acid transporter